MFWFFIFVSASAFQLYLKLKLHRASLTNAIMRLRLGNQRVQKDDDDIHDFRIIKLCLDTGTVDARDANYFKDEYLMKYIM